MEHLTSRKLVGAIAAMLSVVGLVIGSAVVGNVSTEVLLTAIGAVTGLGGYQVQRQARIDENVIPTYVVGADESIKRVH